MLQEQFYTLSTSQYKQITNFLAFCAIIVDRGHNEPVSHATLALAWCKHLKHASTLIFTRRETGVRSDRTIIPFVSQTSDGDEAKQGRYHRQPV